MSRGPGLASTVRQRDVGVCIEPVQDAFDGAGGLVRASVQSQFLRMPLSIMRGLEEFLRGIVVQGGVSFEHQALVLPSDIV